MVILETNICVGLGDFICMKGQIEPFKDRFERIILTCDPGILTEFKKGDMKFIQFLKEYGNFFFGQPPYELIMDTSFTVRGVNWKKIKGQQGICRDYGMPLVKPNLKNILCRGALLNLNEEFIVITTKHRTFTRRYFDKIGPRFWEAMNKLARKYRIVILGEKIVEQSREYKDHGIENTYGVYQDIIKNLPADRILDLTIPALGITPPNLAQIRQDCMTMHQAKFVVMLGIGGAFCMATAVGNVIGHRMDGDGLADELYDGKVYPDAFITKSLNDFIEKLESYL